MASTELCVEIDAEVKHIVEYVASANDQTVSEWLTEAIEEKLQDEDFSGGPGPSGTAGFT